MNRSHCSALLAALLAGAACAPAPAAEPSASALPPAAVDASLSSEPALDTAYLAGGCFWGVEAVFEHVRGVRDVVSGYSGGSAATATYGQVSSGATPHAESVRVVFDPSEITYGQVLRVFFSVAHDPTQVNRQGPDVGPQYRSAVFYHTAEQQRIVESYVAQLTREHAFTRPIATQVVPFTGFFEAEPYHQDYAEHHPDDPYIVYNDAPKVARLKVAFREMYRDR